MRGLFLLGTALWLLSGCERGAAPAPLDQSLHRAQVLRVQATGALETYRFVARVAAAQTVDLAFEVDGPLAQLPVLPGSQVKRGTLVAALDKTDFELAVQEAVVARQLAVADRDRKRALLNRRGISRAEVDQADAEAALATVRLSQAEEALADATLRAPFDAYIARRYLDQHSTVRSGDAVLRLLDLSELHLRLSVPEALAATGDPERLERVEASFAFAPDRRFPLTFRENQGEAQSLAQSFELTFALAPPADLNVLPGMTAVVDLALKALPGERANPRLPVTAVVSHAQDQYHVWLVDPADGTVQQQPVTVGRVLPEGLEILTGLSGGEWVVGAGAAKVQAGMQIEPLAPPIGWPGPDS